MLGELSCSEGKLQVEDFGQRDFAGDSGPLYRQGLHHPLVVQMASRGVHDSRNAGIKPCSQNGMIHWTRHS